MHACMKERKPSKADMITAASLKRKERLREARQLSSSPSPWARWSWNVNPARLPPWHLDWVHAIGPFSLAYRTS